MVLEQGQTFCHRGLNAYVRVRLGDVSDPSQIQDSVSRRTSGPQA